MVILLVRKLSRISNYFMELGSFSGVRFNMMFLLAQACLMRGESVRKCELADLFTLELENEGFTPCRALVVLMEQGKPNQFGRKELGACIRHRHVENCPVGAVGLYFCDLWDGLI